MAITITIKVIFVFLPLTTIKAYLSGQLRGRESVLETANIECRERSILSTWKQWTLRQGAE